MEKTTRERAQMLLELASKATGGEWEAKGRNDYSVTSSSKNGRLQTVIPFHNGDAQFIATSRTEVPYLAQRLIDALDVLEKIVNHPLLTGNPFHEAGMTDELIMMIRKSDAYDELQSMARRFLEDGE